MIGGNRPAWARRRDAQPIDRRLMQELAAALLAGDGARACAVLTPDAELIVDGGREASDPPAMIQGRAAAAARLGSLITPETGVAEASVNGAPGLVLSCDDRTVGVITATRRSRLLARVWVVRNPERLQHWNR